jgi:phenylalanyl-tRNA synthetase beta chain
MKISLKWLQEFVDVKEYFSKPEALAEILTRAGLEVEEIQNKARDFENVVIGLILEKDKHPNADKLSLCRVTTGEGVVHQIVCGAQNHKAGDRVVVALPGALLPGNFAIKKSVIRDVESGGMLCSLKELGLAKEGQGIEILPEDAPIGKSFAEYRGYDDVTFDLKVTANRADCLSHYGLAREVACLLGRKLNTEPLQSARQAAEKGAMGEHELELQVRAIDLCPRYTGLRISAVKVGKSPAWLEQRLQNVGLNSINNVVDATNYAMLELGQPLHAFDAQELKGRKVVIDRAQAGEKFVTLDGTELALTGEELMIKDGERSVCMAGVIGGQNSGVSDSTTEIFLEAAYFTPQSVRKTMRSHGLNTDSGYRFARGVDPEGTLLGLHRAAEIIVQVAGGKVLSDVHDFYPTPQKKQSVALKVQTVSDRLGYEAQAAKFEDLMTRLGCQVEKVEGDEYRVLPPSFRFDLESDMDLVEEYARLNGYDLIPETLPAFAATPSPIDATYTQSERAGQALRSAGFSQAMGLALVGAKSQLQFLKNIRNLNEAGLAVSEMPVKVLNPLNEEQDSLRLSLSYGLFKNVQANFHQGNLMGRIYEIGKTLSFRAPGDYQEYWRLGFAAWGSITGLWQKETSPVVFEVKAAMETLLRVLNINSYQWVNITEKGHVCDFLHRAQNAVLVVEGKKIGFLGTVHPILLEEAKLRTDVALAEFDLGALLQGQPRGRRTESFSRFPTVQRDLALVMAKSVRVGEVSQEIRKEAGPYLQKVEVFDVYEGEKLEVGKKSVAFRLTYQDKKDTLRDQVVNESIQKVLAHLQQKFQMSVR